MNTLLNAVPCSQCQAAPELHRDESRGLFMPVCRVCKYHSAPWTTETGAVALWNRANAEQRECLGCGGEPRLRFSKLRERWAFQCKRCKHSTAGCHTVPAAITAWHRHNTPNHGHYWMLWQQRHQELQAQQGR